MNWQQLAPFIIVLTLSGISVVVRKLQEKAEQKAKLDRMLKARDEAVRAGIDPNSSPAQPATSRAPSLREIAERRRAELESRRAGSARPAPARPSPTARPKPASPKPASPRPAPRPVAPRPATPTPAPIVIGTPRPARIRPRPKPAPVLVEEESDDVPHLPRDASSAPLPVAPRRQPASRLGVISRSDLRRLVMLQEVLARPLAIRDHTSAPGW